MCKSFAIVLTILLASCFCPAMATEIIPPMGHDYPASLSIYLSDTDNSSATTTVQRDTDVQASYRFVAFGMSVGIGASVGSYTALSNHSIMSSVNDQGAWGYLQTAGKVAAL